MIKIAFQGYHFFDIPKAVLHAAECNTRQVRMTIEDLLTYYTPGCL